MEAILIVFGGLTCLVGMLLVVNPDIVFGLLRNQLDKPVLHVLAVVVRLLVGALLIRTSGVSRFPVAIEILGWLSIAAAVSFAFLRRDSFKRLMTWALSLPAPVGRLGGVVAAAFGAFLVFAFV